MQGPSLLWLDGTSFGVFDVRGLESPISQMSQLCINKQSDLWTGAWDLSTLQSTGEGWGGSGEWSDQHPSLRQPPLHTAAQQGVQIKGGRQEGREWNEGESDVIQSGLNNYNEAFSFSHGWMKEISLNSSFRSWLSLLPRHIIFAHHICSPCPSLLQESRGVTKLKLLVRGGSCTFLGVISEFFLLSLTRKT